MGSQKQVQLLEKGEENLLKEQQELGGENRESVEKPASHPVSRGGRTPTERLVEASGLSHMLTSNPTLHTSPKVCSNQNIPLCLTPNSTSCSLKGQAVINMLLRPPPALQGALITSKLLTINYVNLELASALINQYCLLTQAVYRTHLTSSHLFLAAGSI